MKYYQQFIYIEGSAILHEWVNGWMNDYNIIYTYLYYIYP